MIKKYVEVIKNDLIEVFDKKGMSFEPLVVSRCTNLGTNVRYWSGDFPKIVFMCDPEYVCDDSFTSYIIIKDGNEISKELDYSVGILARPSVYVQIICDNPEQNAVLEDIISSEYDSGKEYFVDTENSETIKICMKKKEGEYIKRSVNHNTYISAICISSVNAVLAYNIKHHPSMIAFDPFLQLDMLERYIAYNELVDFYYNKIPFQMFEDDIVYIPSDNETKLNSKYKCLKETTNQFIKSTEMLDEDHSDEFSAIVLMKIMKNNKKDTINEALEIYEKKEDRIEAKNKYYSEKENNRKEIIKQEKDKIANELRKEKRERMLDSHGDPEENRYLDVVISNLKATVGDDIDIYGGSTYMDYLRKRRNKELRTPCLLVKSKGGLQYRRRIKMSNGRQPLFPEWHKYYYTLTNNKLQEKEFYLDYIYFFPYIFLIEIEMVRRFGEDDAVIDINTIEEKIKKEYHDGKPLYIMMPQCEDLYSKVELKVSNGWSDEKKTIMFCERKTVYCASEYDKNELETNPRLQYNLMDRILFYIYFINRIKESIDMLPSYFNYIYGKTTDDSIDDKPEDIETLKSLYLSNEYISRELFNKVMCDAVCVYPMLFDQFIQGVQLDQILSGMNQKKCEIEAELEKLYSDLKIPDKNESDLKYDGIDFRCEETIEDLIKMISDYLYELKFVDDDLFEEFKNKKTKVNSHDNSTNDSNDSWGFHQENFGQQFYQEQYVQNDVESHSSGLGFVGTTAAVLVGNTISNHFEDKKRKRELEEERRKLEEERRHRETSEKVRREFEEQRERNERNEREKKERTERMRRYNAEMDAYNNAVNVNRERERKGLTPLPLPPRPTFPH